MPSPPAPRPRGTPFRGLAAAALALLALAGLALSGPPGRAQAQERSALGLTPEEWTFVAGRKIRIAVDAARPPFEYVDERGRYAGLCADYMRSAARTLGLDLEIVPGLPAGEAVARAEAGEIDVIPKITPTPERGRSILFTAPYVTFPSVIVTRADFREVAGLDDLDGLRVGVVKGLVVEEVLRRDRPRLPLEEAPNVKEGLLRLSTGQLDAFIDNLGTVSHGIDTLGLTNLRIAARTPYGHDLAFGVRRDMPLLRSALDKALAGMPASERNAIKRRWVPVLDRAGLDWRALAPYAAAVVALLAGILAWNRHLKGVVRERERIQAELREHAARLEAQARLKAQVAQVSASLQAARTRTDLAEAFLGQAAPLLGAQYGVFHVLDGPEVLTPVATYGGAGVEWELGPVALGQGLVGQCALAGAPVELDDPGGIPLRLAAGWGTLAPRRLRFEPIRSKDRTLGVLTLAFLGTFPPERRDLLAELLPMLALNLEILAGHLETARLLEAARTQTRDLDTRLDALARLAGAAQDRDARLALLQGGIDALRVRCAAPPHQG